ncbi:MAG: hypothetical protein QXS12_05800, partial [Candidatus Caldarchaeum sp.]
DFGKWFAWVVGMLVNGVIPQALGYDEQWTVSVQHSREDVEKALEVMKKVVKQLKDAYIQVGVEEIL